MRDLFITENRKAKKIDQAMGLPGLDGGQVRQVSRTRSLSPAKAGKIYGKFIPAPTGSIKVRRVTGIETVPMTRRQRRELARRLKNGK